MAPPLELATSNPSSQRFSLYVAAQVKLGDTGFLSRDITVRELMEVKSDVHHVFPKDVLKRSGASKGQYNQLANYAVTQSEINIAIGNKEPGVYLAQMREQCEGGPKRYGNIVDIDGLRANLAMHCIPKDAEHMGVADYPAFLAARRKLMARKLRRYFESL